MSNQQIELQSLLSQKDLMQPHLLEVEEATDLNEENFQSRDTLLSLVQSCSCGSRSHEMSISSCGDGFQGCRRHHPLQPQRLRNLHYGTNIGVSNVVSTLPSTFIYLFMMMMMMMIKFYSILGCDRLRGITTASLS